jgi:DNA-directed RNA polymerase subunit alpha
VRRVSFEVTKTRVGRLSDHDSLAMEVWTDGSLRPEDALRQAAQILTGHFRHVAAFGIEPPVSEVRIDQGIPPAVFEMPIEELDLSVRAYNCLKRAGLTRVGEILERMAQGDDEMLVIRNFGQKSLDELRDALTLKGFIEYMPAPAKVT